MGGFNLMATTTNNGWDTPDDTAFVYQGAQAMRTLGQNIDTSTGKGLLAWQSYTPVLSGTGWVKGSGTITGRYVQLGKIVIAEVIYTFSSAGGGAAGSAAPTVTLPVNANTTIAPNPAQVTISDASSGTTYIGQGSIGATGLSANVGEAGGTYTSLTGCRAGVPMTWATGDEIRWVATYEAA
jgi:hypothetical protein